MTRMREGYKNYFFRFFPHFHKIFASIFLLLKNFFQNKSFLLIFFVYLQSEIFKYHEKKI